MLVLFVLFSLLVEPLSSLRLNRNGISTPSLGGVSMSMGLKSDDVDLSAIIREQVNEQLLDAMKGILKDQTGVADLVNGVNDESSSSLSKERSLMINGVIRIYCTHSAPKFTMPWQRERQEFSTSTGFIIDGQRILTNAHAIEWGSLIQVKKGQSEKKYLATMEAVGHECDLAILKIEDASFFDGLTALKFGELPDLFEEVQVLGYPVGGDSLSITSGVVSRIEMQEYAQADAHLLAIQIDAAINPGNSGGPVVNDNDEVIGVAFQSLSDEDIENIGYVIPVNVVKHFLEDVERHGKYSGVSGLGVRLQAMENDVLRQYYGMAEEDTGILILSTADTAPCASILQRGDVLTKVDGVRIANDGTIPFRNNDFMERVAVHYHFTQKFASDKVTLEIIRNKKKYEVECPLWASERLIPLLLSTGESSSGAIIGGSPSYVIIGGLVLTKLTKEYLRQEFNTEHMSDFEAWAEEFRLLAESEKSLSKAGEEIVLLSQVLSHPCNIGYETFR